MKLLRPHLIQLMMLMGFSHAALMFMFSSDRGSWMLFGWWMLAAWTQARHVDQ